MTRIAAPDGACTQIDVGGRRYLARDGIYTVTNPADAKAMLAAGAFAATVGARADTPCTFRCPVCDFASYFRDCSRCGATDEAQPWPS